MFVGKVWPGENIYMFMLLGSKGQVMVHRCSQAYLSQTNGPNGSHPLSFEPPCLSLT